jgi:RHS repeat-associated protein
MLLVLAFLPHIHAQTLPPTTADDQAGEQAYMSYHGGDIDSIGLSNGALSLKLPFLSYPQRGKLHVSFDLMYHDSQQHQGYLCINAGGKQTCTWTWGYGGVCCKLGVSWAQNLRLHGQSISKVTGSGTQALTWYYSNFALQTPDGTRHPLGNLGTISWTPTSSPCAEGSYVTCEMQSGPFETLDATGWRVNGSLEACPTQPISLGCYVAPSQVIDPDGVIYGNGTLQDPNGNEVTSNTTTITDSLGRQIPLPPTAYSTQVAPTNCPVVQYPPGIAPIAASYAVLWTPPGYNGGTAQYTFCYANIPTTINYFVSPSALLQSIVLPNGQSWQFQYYDSDGTNNFATLSQITLPTGGTISYTYAYAGQYHDSLRQDYGRWVATRTINDGTGPHTWTYTYNDPDLVGGSTTVTDPLGNDVVHTFSFGNQYATYETQAQYYQGSHSSGTLIKTVNTAYSSLNDGSQSNAPLSVVPISVTTVWGSSQGGQTSEVTKSYDAGFSYTDYVAHTGVPGIYGKVVTEQAYDYPTGTSLLRTTSTSYAWQSPNPNYSSYLTNNLIDSIYSVQVKDGGGTQRAYTTYGYDESGLQSSGITEQKVTGETHPGNQTSVHRWLNSGTLTCPGGGSGGSGGYTIANTIYFDTGKIYSASDPCSNSTSYLYSNTYFGAFPTTVTNALNQQSTNVYDFNTGVLTSSTDPNQLVSTYTYDSMSRPLQANHPDNGQDTITRQETTPPFTATLTSTINTTQNKIPLSVFDGLGRVSQTQLTSDPQGIVYTDKTYDVAGRLATVSNPYRGGTDATSSPGITTYNYDALGRKLTETYPDNSVLATAYCGPDTLVTDPTGKWRRSRTDALGRLVEVDEPNAVGATVASTGCPGTGEPIWVTSYSYDALGNLTQAVQNGSHTRTFTYDSLSRLFTSANPETGTIAYTYNPDGPVLTKTDARSITTSYTYDALHRATGVSYSNGDPSLSFTYDGTNCLGLSACQNIGHRTSMTDGAGSESWAYQVDKPNSRSIHREQRTTNSSPNNITKTTTYYLDLAGNVTQLVYPTGRTVNYTHDSADRPSTAADASNGITYATDWKTPPAGTNCTAGAVCYTPQGSVYSMSIGQTTSYNGFNVSETFNNRLQPNEIKAGTALDITYNFVDPVSQKNAGHVYKITNNLASGRSQTFTYDQVNRIISAGTTATTGSACWGYQFTYDAWGNLLSQAGWSPTYNACTQTNMAGVTADGNNHISGLGYDSSGNTLSDGNYSYTWDGESQMKTAAGVTYAYDGDGRRAAKVGSKLYWYGSGGEILSETDASGNTLNDYVFFGGKRVAMVPASGSALYYAEDNLGSSRVMVQSNGTLCYDADFTPFGGEKTQTSTCAQNYKFEGKERDTETQNDDFGAREYSWRFGRWLSSDWSAVPVPVPYANLNNPQTLNLYSMVGDDPESFADLDGHEDAPCGCGGMTAQDYHFMMRDLSQIASYAWAGIKIDASKVANAVGKVFDAATNSGPDYAGPSHIFDSANKAQQNTQQPQTAPKDQSTPANPQGSNYQPNPKHDQPGGDDRKGVSPQPQAGGSLMDQAVQVKSGSSVAVDQSSGKFVVYKTDANGQTHGYETTWKGLRNDQRAALQKAGQVTQKGKIVKPEQK